ncbi:hypothetical protein Dimus_015607, partial [Dionaea muscipula]
MHHGTTSTSSELNHTNPQNGQSSALKIMAVQEIQGTTTLSSNSALLVIDPDPAQPPGKTSLSAQPCSEQLGLDPKGFQR